MIEHDNILWVADISEIGGVETYVYEVIKKYKDLDIAVVYRTGNKKQIERLNDYCYTYKHNGEKIKCKVAVINYDVSIIDYIDKDAIIYQTIHADYENPAYKWKPPTHDRIYKHIAITKHIEESFKRITGKDNVIQLYNPLTVSDKKKLVLLSATRLSVVKGKDRMIALGEALNRAGVDYTWFVFTNDTNAINNDNIIYMSTRLDPWIVNFDYLVQLSDTEGLSYSINEALYRNIPVIVTPLPYLNEIGVKHKKNALILDFDLSNLDEIVKIIKNYQDTNTKLEFKFKHLNDDYSKILAKGKSKYYENELREVEVECITPFYDLHRDPQRLVPLGETWKVQLRRAKWLKSINACKIKEENL